MIFGGVMGLWNISFENFVERDFSKTFGQIFMKLRRIDMYYA